MKKLNYVLLLVIGVILLSCGGKNSERKSNEPDAKEASVRDCLITELDGLDSGKNIVKKGSKDLFTGIAIEKDQSDSIIRKVDIKKGWLIQEIKKQKVNEKYVVITDKKYENAKEISGYELELDVCTDSDNNSKKMFTYVKEYRPVDSYNESYEASVYFMGGGHLHIQGPKSDDHQDWIVDGVSEENIYQILDKMKKEFQNFNYWKN